MLRLIGKKVVSIKGEKLDKRKKTVYAKYIMFDDGKTYIQLEDQDYYSYHDCSPSAKHINVYQDKEMWDHIMNDDKGFFCDATDGDVW